MSESRLTDPREPGALLSVREVVNQRCSSQHSTVAPSVNRTRKTGFVPCGKTASTRLGLPSAPTTRDPGRTSPIETYPVGVSTGASSGCAFPMLGLAARITRSPGWKPLVRRSRSAKPVEMPVISSWRS